MGNIVGNSKTFKRYNFNGTVVPADWYQKAKTGVGMAVAVSAGAMAITTGTTSNDSLTMACIQKFTPRCRVRFIAKISQRIANQTFSLKVSNSDGNTYAYYRFDGTSATACIIGSASGGNLNTEKSPGTAPASNASFLADMRFDMDRVIFSMAAADSAASMTTAAHYDKNCPAIGDELYIEIIATNGTSPATTTTFSIEAVMISELENMAMEVVPGQAISNPATAVPIVAATTIPVSAVTPTASTIVAAASTNATVVKSSAGTIMSIAVSNEHTAAQYLKIYNKSTTPAPATDQPVLTIPLAASSQQNIDFGALGMRMSAGIGIAITGLMPYTDTTNAVANGVRSCISYQ